MILAAALLASFQVTPPDPEWLKAWRTPDAKGAACASCHSPDGIELSAYGFDKADLLRRASRHLDAARQSLVLRLILAGRDHFPAGTADPMNVRPLQPGGAVLPGATAEARDGSFMDQVERVSPSLLGPRVRSLADARRVEKEILAVDLKSLPVGIAMNRLSEDGFHGEEHASLAHWIPDVPMPSTAAVIDAQQRYLESPSMATLQAMDTEVRKAFKPTSGIQMLALEKYRSLMVLQHRLRMEAKVAPGEAEAMPEGNPFWQIAEVGRQYADSGPSQLALPSDVAQAKTTGPKLGEQMKALRLPWYWLGWIADPTLRHSGYVLETVRADYFSLTLLQDGPYPAHALFMLTRKLIQQAATRPFEIQYTFLVLEKPLIEQEPIDPARKAKFRRMAGNAFRTCLWLLTDQLKRKSETVFPESQGLQIRTIQAYLRAIGEPEDTLAVRALKLVNEAKVKTRPAGG